MNTRSQRDSKVFIYGVKKIFKHPDYSNRNSNNDIALLKLNATVSFTEYLYPICLPTSSSNDAKAIVTGFGKTGRHDSTTEKLMKVILEIFSHNECQELLKTAQINQNTMICYGNRVLRGDSCRVNRNCFHIIAFLNIKNYNFKF